MGLGANDDGVDHEAVPAFDYHAIFANPRDDEAPPVWGYRAPSRWSRMSDEDLDKSLAFIATCIAIALLVLWTGVQWHVQVLNSRPSFSVALAGYGGIDPGNPGRVVSPAFDVTLRMNRTCVDRADVVVSYAGVALGWARAEPWDCPEKQRAKDVEVVARGSGVGLPMHLRDRMASEWRSGKMELDIDVTIFGTNTSAPHGAGDLPLKVMTCKVRFDGQKSEPLSFAWYELHPYIVYDD